MLFVCCLQSTYECRYQTGEILFVNGISRTIIFVAMSSPSCPLCELAYLLCLTTFQLRVLVIYCRKLRSQSSGCKCTESSAMNHCSVVFVCLTAVKIVVSALHAAAPLFRTTASPPQALGSPAVRTFPQRYWSVFGRGSALLEI
jgi:hypothetical protein